MIDDGLQEVLFAMKGARLDEFTLRVASIRLTFSKTMEERQAQFIVETNGYVLPNNALNLPYENAVPISAELLYSALERELKSIEIIERYSCVFKFGGELNFYIVDRERMWDNIFSLRTVDWTGSKGQRVYFF